MSNLRFFKTGGDFVGYRKKRWHTSPERQQSRSVRSSMANKDVIPGFSRASVPEVVDKRKL